MATFIDSLFQRESMPVLEAGMGYAHQKQLAIMNNIANVETPYYKRQDLPEADFQKCLNQALNQRAQGNRSEFNLENRFSVKFDGNYPYLRIARGMDAGLERHDENSVVIEKEMADLAKNSLKITAMQRLIKKKFDMMQASLRDRVM